MISDDDQIIDYEALTKDALRGVARKVLRDIEKDGLPGEHHLFISFETGAPGVIISKRLREEYPHEMTIVLQHRFWDLEVHEDRFQVKLTFNAIPERLTIPFDALKVFYDPSVPFGLQFAAENATVENIRRSPVLMEVPASTEGNSFPLNPEDYPTEPLEFLHEQMSKMDAQENPSEAETVETGEAMMDEEGETESEAERGQAEKGSAEIVELDHFRKN